MTRISELSAERLARHAAELFPMADRHRTVARLLHRALELDPHQPAALRCLADLLDHDGLEYLAALVLEYALAPGSPLTAEERDRTDSLRFELMWAWGFARHESGSSDLGVDEFRDRSKFAIDSARYGEFLDRATEVMGPPDRAFAAIHTLVGAMGGLLSHSLGGEALLEEVMHPERFQRTAEYDAWLAEDAASLGSTRA